MSEETSHQTPADVRPASAGIPPESEKRCCPQCGSTRIRKHFHPLLLNLGMWGMFVALAQMKTLLAQISCVLPCATVVGLVACPLLLPVTIAMAVAGRHRCRDCGYRFRWEDRTDAGGANSPFPVNLAVLGALLLGAAVITGLALIVTVPHRPAWIVLLGVIVRVFVAAFLVGICVLFQALLWRASGPRAERLRTRRVLLLLPFVLLGIVWIGWASFERRVLLRQAQPEARAARILRNGQLADLPDSVAEIKVYTWSSPFSGEEYLRFTAEPNDIRRFEDESPALKGKTARRYKVELERWSVPEETETEAQQAETGREVFPPHPNGPPWYRPGIDHPARRYEIQPEGYQLPGEVIVDDEQHIVYVYLCFS